MQQKFFDRAVARNMIVFDADETCGTFSVRLVELLKNWARRSCLSRLTVLFVPADTKILLPTYFQMSGQTSCIGKEVDIPGAMILGIPCVAFDKDYNKLFKTVGGVYPQNKQNIVIGSLADTTALMGAF